MANLNNLKKGQTITEHIDVINENVNLVNEEVNELKNNQNNAVISVNGETGNVLLDAVDVGAFPNSTSIRELDINNIKDTGVYIGTNANNPYYLIVIKYNGTNIYQEIIGLYTKKYRRFTGTWSEWISAYSNENPITASDITGINAFDENKDIEVALLNDGTFVKANLTYNPSTNELKIDNDALATIDYVDKAVNSIKSIIVSELPTTGVENTIYFVPNTKEDDSNEFIEWIWVNGAWEIVGGTSIDLTPFLPKEEASKIYATKQENDAKVPKTTTINNKALSGNITLTAEDVGALPSDTKIETNAVAKYSNSEIATKLSSGEFVNGDAFVVLDDGTYKKGHIYLYNNGLADITNYVDTANDQNIGGIKNFTGLLKYLGEEVATEKYVDENGGKIDTLKVNGVEQSIVEKQVDLDVVESEDYLDGGVGTPLDNYYTKSQILDFVYPVGSIYITLNVTNPAYLFGGTWEKIDGKFLLASDDKLRFVDDITAVTPGTYRAGSTGGEEYHTLTIDEMPLHSHIERGYNGTDKALQALGYASGGNSWGMVSDNLKGYSAQSITAYSTASTGGGEPHNNMPPYLAVYMFKRVA